MKLLSKTMGVISLIVIVVGLVLCLNARANVEPCVWPNHCITK